MNTSETMKTMNDWTNKGVERMTSLGELNLRLAEKMAARQMDAMTLWMEHAMRVMKVGAESKGYNELFKGQVEATKELSERLLAEGKTTLQVVGEARDDYRAWFEKNISEISADLRKETPAA